MEIVNTNRLRIGVRRFRRGYGERPRLWRLTHWRSSDHDKPRLETEVVIETMGLVLSGKWRPDGKRTQNGRGAP